MAKAISLFLTAGAVLPLFWFSVTPNAADYCPYLGGKLQSYMVTRTNGFGELVGLKFDGVPQSSLCDMVKSFPK